MEPQVSARRLHLLRLPAVGANRVYRATRQAQEASLEADSNSAPRHGERSFAPRGSAGRRNGLSEFLTTETPRHREHQIRVFSLCLCVSVVSRACQSASRVGANAVSRARWRVPQSQNTPLARNMNDTTRNPVFMSPPE